jgi:glucose-1-phosphate cytidylyltransferase
MQKKFRTAIILCGGKGTRLGSLGKKTPKTLVKIQKYQILWFIICMLERNGFNHFILPIGYKGRLIKNFIKEKISPEIKIDIIKTGVNSNIAERIFKIKKYIKSENFLILNGDCIFDFNINKIYQGHIKKKIDMTFISFAINSSFGTIGFKNNKIYDFKREMKYDCISLKVNNKYLGYIYSGMSVMNIKTLNKNFRSYKNFEKNLYPWIIKNFKCQVVLPKGFWYSIDSIKDVNYANYKNTGRSYFYKINKILRKLKKSF